MKRVFGQLGVFLLLSITVVLGCQEQVNEEKALISIWKIGSSTVNGIEIGDGKGWLHFHENGTIDSRTGPQLYDSGNYKIDTEHKKIELFTDTTKQIYDYVMAGDSLIMRAKIETMALVLRTVKVNEYPIKRIDDIPQNFQP